MIYMSLVTNLFRLLYCYDIDIMYNDVRPSPLLSTKMSLALIHMIFQNVYYMFSKGYSRFHVL